MGTVSPTSELTASKPGRHDRLSELIHALSSGCLSHLESLLIRVFDGLTLIKPWLVLILDRFLQEFIKLQACTLCDIPKEVLHSVVRHQGDHLRQLRFSTSHMETFRRLGRAEMDGLFSPEEIEALSAELPLIERLGIDLMMGEKMRVYRASKYLELNVPAHSTLRPVRDWTTWLNASVAEEAFRYVDTMKQEVPLKQLDIQRAQIKPTLNFYPTVMPLDFWCIYSCWRETGASNQVHVVRLPSKVGGLAPLTVQDLYEQTLDSAGLGDSEMAGFDPGIY
ncbi:uncharacterized protein KD926_000097 [Aspergillus affinis]|uniref:uncharacterized protein n=1 Tax=Aspergillus affinis TaxID=1070780 RepID=UPI0022FEADF4|nr:uncharacterized protein KD926_000097 [Aspergillus affinis]KAI9037681.1 hypothetical protein KD926_000097 [Aspergillus affinis]